MGHGARARLGVKTVRNWETPWQWRASCRTALNYRPVSRPREGRPLELQTKVREDFTITEKAPTMTFSSWLKAPVGYDLVACVPISHLLNVFRFRHPYSIVS